jgi:O-methyltransferase
MTVTEALTPRRVLRGLRRRSRVAADIVPGLLARWRSARRYARLYRKYQHYTMLSPPVWHDNLALCDLHGHGPGCLVECGVWRGGMSAAMAEVLGPKRVAFLLDSFEGLPPADAALDGARAVAYQANPTGPYYYDNCRAEMDEAASAMRLAGIPAPQLIRGWFKDTLPGFVPPEPIRVLRLDADWYDSTRTCLEALFPYVAPRGLVLIDDYFAWDGCARAVHEYLASQGQQERIRQTRHGVAYLIKGTIFPIRAPS